MSTGTSENEKPTKRTFLKTLFSFKPKTESSTSTNTPPSSSPSTVPPPPNLRNITPIDILALEAFLGPIVVPRRHPLNQINIASRTRAQTTQGDIEAQSSPWKRPSISEIIQKSPKRFTFLCILISILICLIPSWILFLNHMKALSTQNKEEQIKDGSKEGSMEIDTLIIVGNACFILVLLTSLGLLIRLSLIFHSQITPPKPSTSTQTPHLIPEWFLPPLPTYTHATEQRRRGTGDVEDQFIRGESLPRYGDERGSKLLLRSLSRSDDHAEEGGGGQGGRIEVFYSTENDSNRDQVQGQEERGQVNQEAQIQAPVAIGEGSSLRRNADGRIDGLEIEIELEEEMIEEETQNRDRDQETVIHHSRSNQQIRNENNAPKPNKEDISLDERYEKK